MRLSNLSVIPEDQAISTILEEELLLEIKRGKCWQVTILSIVLFIITLPLIYMTYWVILANIVIILLSIAIDKYVLEVFRYNQFCNTETIVVISSGIGQAEL